MGGTSEVEERGDVGREGEDPAGREGAEASAEPTGEGQPATQPGVSTSLVSSLLPTAERDAAWARYVDAIRAEQTANAVHARLERQATEAQTDLYAVRIELFEARQAFEDLARREAAG